MAMVVKNNMGAQRTLNTLNQNNKKLSEALSKVSSGMKIVGAKDDSSAYAISERMREMIRSLNQGSQNVQNGSALLRTAAGGIENIVEELRTLKELAIKSANDTNTDSDRLTIQKEFEQRKTNINDIATTTDYNTLKLLDGRYGNSATAFISSVSTRTVSGNVTMIYDDGYNINSDGIYMLGEGFTGTVNVNAQNVKIMQETPDTALKDVTLLGRAEGNANLWIEDLNITNTDNLLSVIKFQGEGNVLSVKGKNKLSIIPTKNPRTSNCAAVINIGTGLTVEGAGSATLNIVRESAVPSSGHGRYVNGGAGIGSNERENSNGYITIGAGVDISIIHEGGAGIGGGGTGSTVGNITIGNNAGVKTQGSIINQANHSFGAGIGSGHGSSVNADTVGNIYIANNAKINNLENYGAGIGSGEYSTVGGITISRKAKVTASSNMGNHIGAGYNGTAGTVEYVDDLDISVNTGVKEPGNSSVTTTIQRRAVYGQDAPLKIHHGTQANQAINFFINDMHTKSLSTSNLIGREDLPTNEEDLARYNALSNDKDLQAAWLNTLKLAQNKTLDDIDVITKQNANVAICVIDGAIDYALNESTKIGAYLQRLEYTGANITTMNENVQSAESTIRDADMAKEMTEYTKFNVLQQASQSMLAQANQNASSVLSLLQ